MKRSLLTVLLVVAAVASNAAGVRWAKAYDSAKSDAKTSGKLIMIDFYTDWCGWCKKLDADTYPDPAVVAQSEKFVPVKLNAEKDADGIRLAKKFHIDGYPTILFIDSNENLAYKIVGYEPAQAFAESLKKASTIREDKSKFMRTLKSNPNDANALAGLASLEASTGNVDEAAIKADAAAKSATPAQKGKVLDAYNAVGDGYQNAGQMDKAVPYFQKAIDESFPTQTAYARISISVCYMQTQQPKKAVPYLEALLKMGKEADAYRQDAQQMLEAAKKAG